MKIGGTAKFLETLYTDRMDVYRYTKVQNEDGTIETPLVLVPELADQPCRLSFNTQDSPKDYKVDEVPIIFVPKLFFKPNTPLLANDYVVVRRMMEDEVTVAQLYKGNIGLPAWYPNHQEALYLIDRSA